MLAAGLVAAIAVLAILRPIMMGRARGMPSRDATDAALYRDQLAELERDVERGVISPAEAEGAKAEIARRLITAAKRAEATADAPAEVAESGRAPVGASKALALGAAFATPLLAGVLYLTVGAPGEADRPLAERNLAAEARALRPTQEEAEAEVLARSIEGPRRAVGDADYAALVERLETVVAERPDDLRGNRLLADALMNQRRFADAWLVLDRVIELEGGDAQATLYATRAEAMILAAGGYVSPRAEESIAEALRRDPGLPVARYYAGLSLLQSGLEEEALTLWSRLERDSPPDAPWVPVIRQVLSEARAAGAPGADPTDTPPVAGVPAGVDPAIAAAVMAMSPEERLAFMTSRIAGLEERLRNEGGGPDEWAQLVTSYANIGRMEDARRAYDASQEALSGDEAGFVRERALVLGVIAE
ncbi:MAG: c-type cytochrome biogenesis protein CcmI [Pseudomonadota bacterium]